MTEKKDERPEARKVNQPEGAFTDDDLGEVTGGALPKWWLDGAAEVWKKTDPDKIC